jgi:hypothetical protein
MGNQESVDGLNSQEVNESSVRSNEILIDILTDQLINRFLFTVPLCSFIPWRRWKTAAL